MSVAKLRDRKKHFPPHGLSNSLMLCGISLEFGLCIVVLCYAEPFQKVFDTDSLSFMYWCLQLPWFWYDTTLHTAHKTQHQPAAVAAEQSIDIGRQRELTLTLALPSAHLCCHSPSPLSRFVVSCHVIRPCVRSSCSA